MIIVTGGYNGLGKLIADALEERSMVWRLDRNAPNPGQRFDVREPESQGMTQPEYVTALINCAGINRIAWLEDVTEELWDVVMDTNAKAIYKMTQWCLPGLARAKGTVLNIVSNASHMPMRSSIAYNASKGAAHIMTLQMARELYQRHGITVFGISPNKLKGTGMSEDIDRQVMATRGWTLEQAQSYQKQSLPIGEETDPQQLAEFVAFLLKNKERHKYLHGCILPYGA
jgi:3-oxoacyl-[acyl-carrier protein] reductase